MWCAKNFERNCRKKRGKSIYNERYELKHRLALERYHPTFRNCDTAKSTCSEQQLSTKPLPSMPMSSRLDVSCPQFLLACCLLIQFQLKPRKSTTIFFPTVSFRVCCKYTLKKCKMYEIFCLHKSQCSKVKEMCQQDIRFLFEQTSSPLTTRTIWHWGK